MRTIQRGRLLGSAAVADQRDGDGHEHKVTIAVDAVVATDEGKSVRGVAADAGKSVRGATSADDTTGVGAEEPMHVAQDCNGNLCRTARALTTSA